MATKSPKTLVVHAPNVHVGGGLVLLQALMRSTESGARLLILDARTRDRLTICENATVHYVNRTFVSRLYAEWRLSRSVQRNDTVLCFHGLPPLFRLRNQVVVFVQNRLLVNQQTLSANPTDVRFRLFLERWMLRTFSSNADKIIVQTPSMARDVIRTLGANVNVSVKAFCDDLQTDRKTTTPEFDFLYVSSDEPHKNHAVLLDAWRELAGSGLRPSLALTVPTGSRLARNIENLRQTHLPHVTNLGALPHKDVTRAYKSASALIFPSHTESFGLPLIEAAQVKLPILAPELDYVRDVCTPVQTFDPHSATSIARAVRRYLGESNPTVELTSADEFLSGILTCEC